MAEWSNAPDSKSGIRYSRIEGSNPSLSARINPKCLSHLGVFSFRRPSNGLPRVSPPGCFCAPQQPRSHPKAAPKPAPDPARDRGPYGPGGRTMQRWLGFSTAGSARQAHERFVAGPVTDRSPTTAPLRRRASLPHRDAAHVSFGLTASPESQLVSCPRCLHSLHRLPRAELRAPSQLREHAPG